MFQWNKNKIILLVLALLTAGLVIYNIHRTSSSEFSSVSVFTSEQIAKAEWSVSPTDFQNSSPLGNSYFDYVFSKTVEGKRVYDVPYPFTEVLDRLRSYLGFDNQEPLLVTLFPMGRSLQANAAIEGGPKDPNLYFRFPREVVGIFQEPQKPSILNLKGRLFLGFHEKKQVIEVISYNDDEGRFEYQIVQNYRANAKPQVMYASRTKCLSCHQNQTPIFSEPPWDESNANTAIVEHLQQQLSGKYFGADLKVDPGVPYALDTLTDNANLFHVYQKVWLNLCTDLPCQSKALRAILLYLMSNRGAVAASEDHIHWLQDLDQTFTVRFPGGLKIPSPNILNRDPLQALEKLNAVSREFDPSVPRENPVAILNSLETDTEKNVNNLILGLSEFFSFQDMKWLDRWLVEKNTAVVSATANCTITNDTGQSDVKCESKDMYFKANVGENGDSLLEYLKLPFIQSPALLKLTMKTAKIRNEIQFRAQNKNGMSARFTNGLRILQGSLNLQTKILKISFVDDLPSIELLSGKWKAARIPFSRKNVVSQFAKLMQIPLEDENLSTLEKFVDNEPVLPADIIKSIKNPKDAFTVSCGMCHYNTENSPPAFLGLKQEPLKSSLEICKRIEMCAPRMLYRLKMRNCPNDKWGKKSPMPMNGFFNRTHINAYEWQSTVGEKIIIPFLTQLVDSNQEQKLAAECPDIDSQAYEQLPACEFTHFKEQSKCEALLKVFLGK